MTKDISPPLSNVRLLLSLSLAKIKRTSTGLGKFVGRDTDKFPKGDVYEYGNPVTAPRQVHWHFTFK
jgi:hypothetical protein